MTKKPTLSTSSDAPIPDYQNSITAGERDVRGFAMTFYASEGNWDLIGNNALKS